MNAVKLHVLSLSAKSRVLAQTSSIQKVWQHVGNRAQPNFFLNWAWMASWLESIDETIEFIYALDATTHKHTALENISLDHIYGCAFIYKNKLFSMQNVCFQQPFMLNRTGLLGQDQMWIEYNDFLLDAEHADIARSSLAQYALKKITGSLHMGISYTSIIETMCHENNWQYSAISETHTFQKTIKPQHTALESLIADFSKNTKSQLRRSLKLLKEDNNLSMEIANSTEQAIQWFNDSGSLHKALWQTSAYGSGFDNPIFMQFHQGLIQRQFAQSNIIVAKFSHNKQAVGYIYGFKFEHTFHFYLSAFAKSPNPKIKWGLVAHLYLMQLLATQNITVYDFMGGTARYKESLSDTRLSMGFYRISNNACLFKLDKALRKIKQKLPSA